VLLFGSKSVDFSSTRLRCVTKADGHNSGVQARCSSYGLINGIARPASTEPTVLDFSAATVAARAFHCTLGNEGKRGDISFLCAGWMDGWMDGRQMMLRRPGGMAHLVSPHMICRPAAPMDYNIGPARFSDPAPCLGFEWRESHIPVLKYESI
jgi:hypothetical protein